MAKIGPKIGKSWPGFSGFRENPGFGLLAEVFGQNYLKRVILTGPKLHKVRT